MTILTHSRTRRAAALFLIAWLGFAWPAGAQDRKAAAPKAAGREFKHRAPAAGEIAGDKPGSYAEAGKTYVLTKDIASPMTPIFLGNNVTLDLNGYTVTFADGGYEPVPNYGFEEELKGWDVSKAPGAKAVSTVVRPLVGKKFCSLPEGQEIVSGTVRLPVADRSYYATCAISEANDWKDR